MLIWLESQFVLYCVRARLCLLTSVTVPCVCFCALWLSPGVPPSPPPLLPKHIIALPHWGCAGHDSNVSVLLKMRNNTLTRIYTHFLRHDRRPRNCHSFPVVVFSSLPAFTSYACVVGLSHPSGSVRCLTRNKENKTTFMELKLGCLRSPFIGLYHLLYGSYAENTRMDAWWWWRGNRMSLQESDEKYWCGPVSWGALYLLPFYTYASMKVCIIKFLRCVSERVLLA